MDVKASAGHRGCRSGVFTDTDVPNAVLPLESAVGGFPESLKRAASKIFRHPNIAVDRRRWNCHVFPVARGDGPASPDAVNLPDLLCAAR